MNETDKKFKVVTRCYTYNHSSFIIDTMNGFAMQETTFPVISCIIDDASTDGTQEVIRQYLVTHFQEPYRKIETNDFNLICCRHKNNTNCFFAVFFLKYNHYRIKKPKLAYLAEWRDEAEYEALCEGDDYWIDNNKLQIQADFLDANGGFVMCYTKCKRYYSIENTFESEAWGGPGETFESLIYENTVPTLTVMFRIKAHKKYYNEVNPQSHSWKIGDFPMWLYFSHGSGIKFLDFVSGVYRIINESASHFKKPDEYRSFIESSINIAEFFIIFYNYDINLDNFKARRMSRLATNLAFLYDDLYSARSIILAIEKKQIKDYFKLLLFSNEITMFLYKKLLRR